MIYNGFNILCSADEAFLPYCGIMLTSLFMNNEGEEIRVYLIVPEGCASQDLIKIRELVAEYNQKLEIIMINQDILSKCPIKESDHVSLATYYRLLAPIILPKDIDRILYLDCDIIVNKNIRKLYNSEIEDFSCGVVEDSASFGEAEFIRLGYDKSKLYFNAGVILINLKYWRDQNVSYQSLEFIRSNPDKVLYHDQDALNYILRESKLILPIKYNFQSQFLYKQFLWGEPSIAFKNEIENVILDQPIIIHYSNEDKPWFIDSMQPYKMYFEYYKNRSKWSQLEEVYRYKKEKTVKNRIFDFLVKLGIKSSPTRYSLLPFRKNNDINHSPNL